MADSAQNPKTPEAELLLLEARLEKWCEQFERARSSLPLAYAKKAENRLLAMRERLNILLVENGLFVEPKDQFLPLGHLDDKELEQVAESLQQSVLQFQKLKNELNLRQDLVKKQLGSTKAPQIKKAIDELRAKLDAFHKNESQFRPAEEIVSEACRRLAGDDDLLQTFTRITSRLEEVTKLNKAISEQSGLKDSMAKWLQKQRMRLVQMSFQKPPSEQSLTESSVKLSKVAPLNQSLHRLTLARRYIEGVLAKNGMSDHE